MSRAEYYRLHRAKDKAKTRLQGITTRHHLTEDLYWYLMQDGCDNCGDEENLNIDHDHTCCPGTFSCGSCIRGCLCRGCNFGIGNFKNSPELLRGAALYLERDY